MKLGSAKYTDLRLFVKFLAQSVAVSHITGMHTPSPSDWITRDMQRLSTEGKIARKPTEDEWQRIWDTAHTWSEQNPNAACNIDRFIMAVAPDIITGGSRPAVAVSLPPPAASAGAGRARNMTAKQALEEIRSNTCYPSARGLISFILALEVILAALTLVGILLMMKGSDKAQVFAAFAGVAVIWALVIILSFALADMLRAVVDTADAAVQNRARNG